MNYASNCKVASTAVFDSGSVVGQSGYGAGDGKESRKQIRLDDVWLDKSLRAYQPFRLDLRAENDLQHSRIIPGAFYPPIRMWPALGIISDSKPCSFNPFAEDDESDVHSSSATSVTTDSGESGQSDCSVSMSSEFTSPSSQHVQLGDSVMNVTEDRMSFEIDEKKVKTRRFGGFKARAPKALSREEFATANENPAEVIAVNDLDRFLERRSGAKIPWSKESFELTLDTKLEDLVRTRYSSIKGTRYELLRVLKNGQN